MDVAEVALDLHALFFSGWMIVSISQKNSMREDNRYDNCHYGVCTLLKNLHLAQTATSTIPSFDIDSNRIRLHTILHNKILVMDSGTVGERT